MMRVLPHIALMVLSILAVSCQPHDPFCMHHSHAVTIVEYDWSQAPDAKNIGGTRVYFYRSADGSYAARADFSKMKGGSLYLGEGEYDVVSYNSDTERLLWRGDESLSTLETFTRNAQLTEDLPGFSYGNIDGLVLTPDRIWSGSVDKVWVSGSDTTIITLVPRKATYEVIWKVEGIKGARRVAACAVSISGVGGSLMLDDWHTERNESFMSGVGNYIAPDEASADNDIGGFQGRFETFGCNFTDKCKHTFTIYCWSAGGNIKASYDVTGQFHVVKDDRKIYIHIKADFEIPTGGEVDGDGGFDADVSDWGVVNEDLIP